MLTKDDYEIVVLKEQNQNMVGALCNIMAGYYNRKHIRRDARTGDLVCMFWRRPWEHINSRRKKGCVEGKLYRQKCDAKNAWNRRADTKGKWIVQGEHDYNGRHYYDVLCSRCKMSYQIADYKFNNREIRYCVKCGAKMDKGEANT